MRTGQSFPPSRANTTRRIDARCEASAPMTSGQIGARTKGAGPGASGTGWSKPPTRSRLPRILGSRNGQRCSSLASADVAPRGFHLRRCSFTSLPVNGHGIYCCVNHIEKMARCPHCLVKVTICSCKSDEFRFRWTAARADGSYARFASFSYATQFEARLAGEAAARAITNLQLLRK